MSVEIYKKSEKQIILPGLNEEQQLRLESAKRYCQEQSVRFVMQQQEEETKSFMSGGINGGSVQSQQVLSLMSQVFIGSIFYEVSEVQLRDAFAPFGIINVVNLNLDPVTGKHKGFAFIWFELAEAAQLAIEQMNGANMWGRPIKVGRPTQAQPYLKTIEEAVYDSKRSTCIYVAGIQTDMDDTDIRDLFSPFGEIRQLHLTKDDVSNENKGNAFIEYSYEEKEAADAVKSMNLFELCGQKLRVGKAISPPFSIGEKKELGEIKTVIPKLARPRK